MKKRIYSYLAMLLTLCLLAALPAALAEEDVISKAVETPDDAATAELQGPDESEPIEALPKEAPEMPLPAEEYAAASEEPIPEEAEVFAKDDLPEVVLDQNKKVSFPTGTVFRIVAEKEVLVYRVENRNIATVASGIVTVRRSGITTIKTVFKDGYSYTLTLTATGDPKTPTGISIVKPASRDLDLRKTLTLRYKLNPSTAETDVIWSSSNESIATVEDGVVTPLRTGKVNITATTGFGGYSDTILLNVVDNSVPTRVEIVKPKSTRLDISDTLRLTCRIQPSEADKTVQWVSSDNTVATVEDGLVIPHRLGSVKISAIAENGGKSDMITLTITDKTIPTGITLSNRTTTHLKLTQTLALSYKLSPSTARSSVTWSSNNLNVATVSASGVVTPHRAGTAKITATTNRGGKSASVQVIVIDNTLPTSIQLKVSNPYVMDLSEWVTPGYTILPKSAYSAVTWKSNYPKVASVDASTGKVTAHALGTATITATTVRGNRKASFKVKVVDKHAPVSIRFDEKKPLRLSVGKTWSLRYTIHTGYKGWKPNMNVTFTSNYPSVVRVTNSKKGTIQAMKPGSATITVRTDNGKTAKIRVIVSK